MCPRDYIFFQLSVRTGEVVHNNRMQFHIFTMLLTLGQSEETGKGKIILMP